MKSKIAVFKSSFLIVLFLFVSIVGNAQSDFAETLVAALPNGGAISFQPAMTALKANDVAPLNLSNIKQQTVTTAENGLQRILFDQANGVLFGYALTINKTATNFQISFAPLTEDAALLLRQRFFSGGKTEFRLLTLPSAQTAPQSIVDGETLALDLLVNAQLGLKITDRLRVVADKNSLAPAAPPRDFTLAEIELAALDSKLAVGEKVFPAGFPTRRYQGSLLWFHVPEKGLFVVSLAPREDSDFKKIGVLKNKKISFRIGSELYEWTSAEPFLPSVEGAWFVWVLFKPNYAPPTVALNAQFGEPEKKSAVSSETDWRNGQLQKTYNLNLEGLSVKPEDYRKKTAQKPPRLTVGGAKTLESLIPKN